MKKLLVFFLSLVLCFTVAISLIACEQVAPGGQKESGETTESTESGESGGESSGEESGGQSSIDGTVYTVKFVVEEGFETPTSISVKNGEEITLPTLPEGKKTFKCWVIQGTDTVFTSGIYELETNVTLVAVFYEETNIY